MGEETNDGAPAPLNRPDVEGIPLTSVPTDRIRDVLEATFHALGLRLLYSEIADVYSVVANERQ